MFAVVLEGRLIGTVNLEVDVAARSAMLGYAIGRAWWGQGLATEAARAAMAWGIASFGLRRIWAATDLPHVRSQRVMEKLGLRRESVRAGRQRGRQRRTDRDGGVRARPGGRGGRQTVMRTWCRPAGPRKVARVRFVSPSNSR